MANLIIKPSAGGDLVIKSSDDSPAITVGTTGQATFAEAATMSGNVTMSGTANNLGAVTAGAIPSSLVTGIRLIQHQYVYKGAGVDYVVSNSCQDTMSGSPLNVTTPAFDTTSVAGTIWQISTGCSLNNETGTNWNASMKAWVSYDNGSNWTNIMPGHTSAGKYLAYSGDGNGDAYTFLAMTIYVSLTASNTTTKLGCAFYSQEGDSTRWYLVEGGG